MILCISAVSVVTSPFSFLILVIWVFSLFFSVSLANGLSILFIFSKNQLLVLLIFAIFSFVSFSFISDMIFMISFLLLTVAFFYSSFSNCFRCKVRLFIWDVSCFLEVGLYCYKLSSENCFCCVLWVLGHRAFIVICF